jgi:hypothetical protein
LERQFLQYLGSLVFAVGFLPPSFHDRCIAEELLPTPEALGIKEAASTNESSGLDLTTSAKGSSGMNPGPVLATIDTRPFSSIGDWPDGDINKLVRSGSGIFSALQIHFLMDAAE